MAQAPTPFIDQTFSPTSENLHQDVIAFVVKFIKPDWKEKAIYIKLFSDGISNKLIGCYSGEMISNKTGVLVRINGVGTEKIIDRENEIKTYNMLSTIKDMNSSQLHATFHNGICYEFLDGATLDVNSVRDPHISKLIAQQIAKMHIRCQGTPIAPQTSILETFTMKFFANFPTHFEDPKRQKTFESLPKLSELRLEVKKIISTLTELNFPMVFCHNDLLLTNMLHDASNDQIKFIDFEYSGVNFNCFDIGNHFAEYAGLNEVDYTRYPSKDYQMVWLRHYLEHLYFLQGKNPSSVTEEELNRLYIGVNISALAAHLIWGLWGLYQASNSVIEFDYIDYAKLRFDEFYAKKVQFYSLLD